MGYELALVPLIVWGALFLFLWIGGKIDDRRAKKHGAK